MTSLALFLKAIAVDVVGDYLPVAGNWKSDVVGDYLQVAGNWKSKDRFPGFLLTV